MITLEEFQAGIANLQSTKELIKYFSQKRSECQPGEDQEFLKLIKVSYHNKLNELHNARMAEIALRAEAERSTKLQNLQNNK